MNGSYQDGEHLARLCLEKAGYTVIDRTQNPQYWRKDIDFSVIKGGEQFDIEVKWDNRIAESGAMFLELLTNIQENKQGWANYTEADFIFYGDSRNRLFYIFSVEDMRQYLKTHTGKYKTLVANDYNYHTGQIRKQSLGAIVPIASFQAAVKTQVLDIDSRLKNEPQNGGYQPA